MSAQPSDPRLPDMPRDPERTRGRYDVTLDGRPAGIDERFVLGEIAPGVWRARTTRVLSRPTARLESDVRADADGVSVAIRWLGSGDGVVRDATATLVERSGTVRATRTVDGQTHDEVVLPGRVNTLAHVASGPLVLAAVGGVAVVAPQVLDPHDGATFLAPVAARWTTTPAGAGTALVGGEEHRGTAYDWVDSSTGWTASVVVDDGGLLLRTRLAAPDGELEVTLAEVEGPWPVPLSWRP